MAYVYFNFTLKLRLNFAGLLVSESLTRLR